MQLTFVCTCIAWIIVLLFTGPCYSKRRGFYFRWAITIILCVLASLIPRLYFFFFLSVFSINELEMMGGTKKGHDGRERKSKAWYAKSRDPHTFL